MPGGGAGQRGGGRRQEGAGYQGQQYDVGDLRSNTAQGRSIFIPPDDDLIRCIAHIYFPTSGTELDDDDIHVLEQIRDLYDPTTMLGRQLNLYVFGTADWRPADNDRLAMVRARSVRRWLDNNIGNCDQIPVDQAELNPGERLDFPEHGTNCNALYHCTSQGNGVSGTRADGLTAEQLNQFRAAHIYARIGPVPPPSVDIQVPPPQPIPPVLSTHFKIRILQSCGMDIPLLGLSGNYLAMEIVDTTNNIRRIFRYTGPGFGFSLPFNVSRTSDWKPFTTTVPMNVSDFRGPVIHFSWGIAVVRGRTDDVFQLCAPVIYGGDSVRVRFQGSWSDQAINVGFGVDFGGLEPVGLGWSRVPSDYTTKRPPYPRPWDYTFHD